VKHYVIGILFISIFCTIYGCNAKAARIPQKEGNLKMNWENVEEEAVEYVTHMSVCSKECKKFTVGNVEWNDNRSKCNIIVMSKVCLDVQYLLKVDVENKKVLEFVPLGEG